MEKCHKFDAMPEFILNLANSYHSYAKINGSHFNYEFPILCVSDGKSISLDLKTKEHLKEHSNQELTQEERRRLAIIATLT